MNEESGVRSEEKGPTASTKRRRGGWWGEIAGAFVSAVLIVMVLGAGAVYVISGTDWGHERMRRYAQSFLEHAANGGHVHIGKLTGNLLTGLTVNDFVITDSINQPFIAVARMRGDFGIGDLLHKRVWIDNIVLERPLVVLDRRPSGDWNWRRIFPRDTTPKPASAQNGWTDRLRFTNVRVIGGNLIVRTPWRPSSRLSPAASDSAVGVALSGGSRQMIERVPDGFQKIIEMKAVNAFIPLLRLSDPGYKERVAQIASLTMEAYLFRPPAADLRGFQGTLPFTDDSIWWHGVTARLPNSVISGDGSYAFKSGDLTMRAHAAPAAFADLRWLYPRMPSDAHGKLDFDLKWRDAVEEYIGYNMDIAAGGARVLGSFGITRGDSIAIHHTDLRFSNVDTRLIEQIIEGFQSPRRGTLSGRAKVQGGRNALVVDADVTFVDQRAGTSRVVALGEVGFPGKGVRARNLRLQLRPVQVELARGYAPNLSISGVVTGTATVTGNTASELQVAADLDLTDRGERSQVAGRATIQLAGTTRFDVNATAKPVSLVEIGRFAPSVGLRGVARGPITVHGTLASMDVNADLHVSGGGTLAGRAHLDLSGTKRYDVAVAMHTLDAHAILAKAPETSLSARAVVVGAGTDPATMRTSIAADLSTSQWDSVGVDTASVRVTIADGLAQIGRLYVAGGTAKVTASGSFGMARGRAGTLTYEANVDSLAAFDRWIPGLRNDTTVVGPRPGLVARAMQHARADSARIARETEIERIVTGKAPPKLQVTMPLSVRRDTVGGKLTAAGTISGNLYDFNLNGAAGGENVAARGNFIRRFHSLYAWTNARTPNATLAVAMNADSAMVVGFALDSVDARLSYHNSAGRVEILVRQDERRDYGLSGDYVLSTARNELRVADLRMRLDTSLWRAPHPATIHWGGPGIEVSDFELRNRGNGRVFATGLLPTQGTANFEVVIENFPVGNVVDLLESDIRLAGLVSLSGTMSGTLNAPAFRGAFGITQGEYQGTTLPELHGRFGYVNRELVTHVDAIRNGGLPMATVDGRIPINLAFSGVTGSRLIDAPMSVDLVGDSLPIELIPHFTDAVSDLHGRVAGSVAMRGRLDRPTLTGALVITNTSLTINKSGMHVDGVHGSIRMANDVVAVGDSIEPLVGDARGPLSLRGTIAVGNWREPAFDLYLYANHAEVMNNSFGKLSADVGIALKGPFTSPYLSGQVTIVEGVIRAPEPTGKHIVSAGDPALFDVIDTALVSERDLFPLQSPMLRNMRMEIAIEVSRNTWVRTRDANVEIYTDYPMKLNVQHEAMALTGVVSTDRGDYKFLSKRFAVTRGSAMFIGSKDINPTLQITGEYQVREGAGAAIDVRVLVGGTLKRPRLALESDAQPPKSQSELLSLLAFGQSTTTLASIQGSSLAGTNTLLSQGAQMAGRQYAGIALSQVIDQVEASFGQALATDYFNITPADVPTELANANGVGNFLTTTRFEGGKYLNPRTFVVGQMMGLNVPGARVQYRASEGWRYEASAESRYLLKPPTLSDQNFIARRAFGAFVIRQWKF
jgi:translocation and assembly module TamB